MSKTIHFLIFTVLVCTMSACAGVKDVAYMQDFQNDQEIQLPEVSKIKVGVGDKLTIVVNSKDVELAMMFNLPVVSIRADQVYTGFSGSAGMMSSYSIDDNGFIDFPVVGKIHVLGLTRTQIAEKVKNILVDRSLVKDAVVTVEFSDMYVSVIGDVQRPGRYQIDKDRITVVDVLSKAGDLNITGLRKNISVYREIDGKQHCYQMDFTNAQNVFQSPAYYLHQDDVIYVQPNSMKARSSTVNGNNLLSTSFWISVGSLATSVLNLVLIYVLSGNK